MTNEYRQNGLNEAQAKYNEARKAYDNAKTKAIRNSAADDLEFWGNKLAFFTCLKPEAM